MSWWPAIGPAAIGLLLLVRAIAADGLEPAIAGPIALVLFGIAAFVARRRPPWSAALLMVGPVALVTTPARTEFAFNLARPDDTGWYVFTLAVAAATGLSVAAAATVVAGDRLPRRITVPAVTLLGAVGFAVLVQAVDPQPDLGDDLTDAQLAALPEVALVNYGYGLDADAVRTVDDGSPRLRARLVNDSDLPHTFTVDGLVDVYVPAGREAVLDAELPTEDTAVRVYCAVGDHEALGMVVELQP